MITDHKCRRFVHSSTRSLTISALTMGLSELGLARPGLCPPTAPASAARHTPCASAAHGPGINRGNEQFKFPPLPCDRCPSSGHALRDLPPHRRVPARQPERGPDRALPPSPSRSARPSFPVVGRQDPALSPRIPCGVGRPETTLPRGWAGECRRSRSVVHPWRAPHAEPSLS